MRDRMCSMTFGRPPLLPNHYMQVDLPDEADLEEFVEDPTVASRRYDMSTSSLLRSTAYVRPLVRVC